MRGKTVLVTGGNSGIGKETAIALAQMGANVVVTSRDPAKGKAAAEEMKARAGVDVPCLALDLASFDSIRAFAKELLAKYDALHVLVLNAGLVLSERTETKEGFETTFGVNHLGHFFLTDLLRERIVASAPARIVVVSSDAHRRAKKGLAFDDLQRKQKYAGMDVYCESKLANIYFTRELARRLEGTKVTVNALHPGVIASGFAGDGDAKGVIAWLFKLGRPFLRTPRQGAQTTIFLASSPAVEGVTGKYFDSNAHEVHPTRIAQDDAAAKRLWSLSEELVARGAP
jgi:NAD(P)-dependent dehydrogenase (short-subunit alcohol dehydrogenase family)